MSNSNTARIIKYAGGDSQHVMILYVYYLWIFKINPSAQSLEFNILQLLRGSGL